MLHTSVEYIIFTWTKFFFIQLYCFILLFSGDVKVNPGPTFENALDIIHLNIWSIRNNLDYLNTFIHDFDIACFTETH